MLPYEAANAGTRSMAIRYSRSARARSPRSVASSARLRCASARSASTASERSYSASAASKAARSSGAHLLLRNRGQRSGGIDADREDRVAQQRRREGQALGGRKRAHRLEGAVAHERLRIAKRPNERVAAPGKSFCARSEAAVARRSGGRVGIRGERGERSPGPGRLLAGRPGSSRRTEARAAPGRPTTLFAASAAQRSERSRWHCVQALGVPIATERSGRGTRKL